MGFTYLASPYSHPDEDVRLERYEAACRAAARLMDQGEVVFSPIAHSHPIELVGQPKKPTHDFWMRQDRPILQHAAKLAVLMLPGWQNSKGVSEEVMIAHALHLPVEYIEA